MTGSRRRWRRRQTSHDPSRSPPCAALSANTTPSVTPEDSPMLEVLIVAAVYVVIAAVAYDLLSKKKKG